MGSSFVCRVGGAWEGVQMVKEGEGEEQVK